MGIALDGLLGVNLFDWRWVGGVWPNWWCAEVLDRGRGCKILKNFFLASPNWLVLRVSLKV